MKMGLARGSFGSDYWHNCVYAMDDADYTTITPTYPDRRRLPGYAVPRPASPPAASSRTSTSAPPRPIPATRRSAPT